MGAGGLALEALALWSPASNRNVRTFCLRAVLVPDFWGGDGIGDTTLLVIKTLLMHLKKSGHSVREYLPKSPLVSSRFVTSKSGNEMYLYCLELDKADELIDKEEIAALDDVAELTQTHSGDTVKNVSFISMPAM